MAHRPCKPDSDLKRLWQTLLPGTVMPACGTAQDDTITAKNQDDDRDESLARQAPSRSQ